MTTSTRLRTSLSASTILAAGLLLVVTPAQAQNLPDTSHVSSVTSGLSGGAAGSTNPGFSTSGTAGAQTLQVDLKDNRTILNWGGTGFNVAAGNTIDFKDARATAGVTGRTDNIAVLNRDMTGNTSNILGTIKSDPNVAVYVLNQSGILFGDNAVVNTGAFFAGTSNLSNDNDFLNAATTLRFSGSTGGTITANAGSQFTTAASASSNGGRMGDLVMMGAQVLFRGTAGNATSGGAAGDVALIAASDAAITNTPGSPLSIQIYSGTSLYNGIEVGSASTLRGQNVILAYGMNGYLSGNDGNVNLLGHLVATSAQATDTGVILAVGDPAGSVSMDMNAVSGSGWLDQTGTINSAKNVLSSDITHTVDGAIVASGDVTFYGFVSSNTSAGTITGANVNFGNLTATRGLVTATAGNVTYTGSIGILNLGGGVQATGDVVFDGLAFTLGGSGAAIGGALKLTARDSISISAPVTAGSVDIATTSPSSVFSVGKITTTSGDLKLNSAANIDAGDLASAGALDLQANGYATLGTATSVGNFDIDATGKVSLTSGAATGAASDLTISGTSVGVVLDNTANSLSAGRDVSVTASDFGSYFTARVFAGRNLTISGDNIGGFFTGNTGFVQITGQQSIQAQTIKAGTDVKVYDMFGFTPNVRLYDVTAGNDIVVNAPNAMAQIVKASAGGKISLTGMETYLGGDSVDGPTGTVTAGGDIDVTAGDQAVFEGSVSTDGNLTATGANSIAFGKFTSSSATSLSAKGAVTLTATNGSIGVNNLAGPLTLQGNSDGIGNEAVTLNALAGINLTGSVSAGTNRQSDLQITVGPQGSVAFGSVSARGILSAQTLNGPLVDGLIVPGPVYLTGPVSLTNGLTLRSTSLIVQDALTVGSGNIDIQTTGDTRLAGALSANDISVNVSGADLSIMPGASFTGHDVILSTSNAFVNTAGANIMNISGHWVVYSSYPNNDTFGGLDSGNTALWNATLATRDPSTISGNRYVFSYQPTLTFTSQDSSKVYGTDLTGSTSLPFAVTGYQPGVAGAFLGDTAATAYSGLPSFTSANFTARAPVAGGPAIVTIAQGGLQSDAGYAFSFSSNGILTITRKALTADVVANNKTYDGNVTGTGTVTLNGVVNGDTVGTSGTTFTFSDKNAGTGKTVTVANTSLTGADAGNYTFTIPVSVLADILKKAITANVTANNKTYDGTTAGTGTVTLNGVVNGDTVGTTGTTFTFSDKNAGAGKTVTVAGTSLTGADAGNYSVTVPASVLADILKKAITASVVANNKTYDGTTAGTGTVTLNGVVNGDTVGTSGTTFIFSDKNAGTGKTVTVAGTALTGTDAGNYTVTVPASVLADILKKAITASVVASNKTYDGTTAGSGTVTLNGVVNGDTVGTSGTTFTFADKNAGTGKTVTVAGTSLTGGDAGNYTLTVPASAVADILKKAITATATADNKTYDGTTAGTGTVTLNGVVNGDTVGTSGTTFTFGDKNAGTGKTVAVAGTALTGADAGNYTLTVPASVLADILKKAITANVVANNKTYDGSTAGTGTVTLNGVINGDTVGTSGTTFTFSDKNAGSGKTVAVAGTLLTGADAGNYTVTVSASALADILKKAITASVVVDNKTYDGTTAGTGTVTLNGVVSGDTVGTSGTTFAFGDKNAGTGKTVAVAGTTLTGTDAGNYTVTVPASVLADILKKAITASVSVTSKTYDGTTAGTGTVTLNGVVSGDNVTTSGTTFTYADKNAGTGKAVAVAGTTIGGTDAGNYTITIPASALGDILKRALSVTADDASKVQNDPDPALTYTLTSGSLVSGDAFSGGVARDAGENPGTYAIKIGTLSAGDNYTITFTPGTFTINLPLGSEGLQPALKAQPLPSQLSTGASSGSSVNLDTSAVCGDDKNCTTGKPPAK